MCVFLSVCVHECKYAIVCMCVCELVRVSLCSSERIHTCVAYMCVVCVLVQIPFALSLVKAVWPYLSA